MRPKHPIFSIALMGLLLSACNREPGTHTGVVGTGDDTSVVDVCGNEPDECHELACEECNDSCDEPCAVMESWPQQYGCDGGDTVTVYDVCPDWTDSEATTTTE